MNLKAIREGELKGMFDALEEALEATGTDYYVVGAIARDIWYNSGGKLPRVTKDVDVAVMIGTEQEYESIRKFLVEKKNFREVRGSRYVMFTPDDIQVDILPFGALEVDGTVSISGQGLSSISVTGFREVYEAGTVDVEWHEGERFKMATLPAIVMLKLISFDDRPEDRPNDPRDVAGIIEHYFELQAELIYESHSDLFDNPDSNSTLKETAAIVIGREMRKIASRNTQLSERIQHILVKHISEQKNSEFVRGMVREIDGTVEESVKFLKNILKGMS